MSSELLLMLWNSLLETITMVGISGLLGAAIGIPVGILLYTTTPTGIHPMPVANRLIGWVVNAIRSTPLHHFAGGNHPLYPYCGRHLDRHDRSDCAAHNRRGPLYRTSGGNQFA